MLLEWRNLIKKALLYESIEAGCRFPSFLYLEKSFIENAPYTN
ncbi:hypothetical protein T11_8390 [Trichinella zimbabwensis]|uniref:Uncharacterized protein n=1 Tax=Trichinella zimbabwensis TaxID=268475 RepID=A0A0V1GGH7_9BILA|nr:hypothetical protein T11_8390 [Trichinella zimbabwensis]